MKTPLLLVALVAAAAGCASSSSSTNVTTSADGRAFAGGVRATGLRAEKSTLAMTDFDAAADRLVDSMLDDEAFQKKYDRLAKALGPDRLPVFVVQSLRNATEERINERIDSMSRDIRIRVRKAGKFDLKDDREAQKMVDRIRWSADTGLESGELLDALRTHVSPHYLMTGEVKGFRDGDVATFKLYLALHDLSGVSGDGGLVVWEDVATIVVPVK